jgi:hypothetical protein
LKCEKHCLLAVAKGVCPEKKASFQDIVSAPTCKRHMQELAANLFEWLKLQAESFANYSG